MYEINLLGKQEWTLPFPGDAHGAEHIDRPEDTENLYMICLAADKERA